MHAWHFLKAAYLLPLLVFAPESDESWLVHIPTTFGVYFIRGSQEVMASLQRAAVENFEVGAGSDVDMAEAMEFEVVSEQVS